MGIEQYREIAFTLNEDKQMIAWNNVREVHELWEVPDEERREHCDIDTLIEHNGNYYELRQEIKLQEVEYFPPNFYEIVAEKFFKNNVDMPDIIKRARENMESAKAQPEDYLQDDRLIVHVSTLVGESYGQYSQLMVATAFGTVDKNEDGDIDRDWFNEEQDALDICIHDNDTVSANVTELIEHEAQKEGLEGNFFFGEWDGCGYSLMYAEYTEVEDNE